MTKTCFKGKWKRIIKKIMATYILIKKCQSCEHWSKEKKRNINIRIASYIFIK